MMYLQFINEAAARAALTPWIFEGELPAYIGSAAVDILGVVLRPTGHVIHGPEGDVPEMKL